ncbi:hypothetical protein J5N97_029873 [Dioscorea zingiberensis]|uniref:Histidine-containing phosphotransfer protein n=1 Tax=Dioscorea zingiberensis TaxID=325984 RepID=A0A9D5BWM3_9LILI|nr:hypothetical protein J5N97_029873 [Dioscorea zingiberensis]
MASAALNEQLASLMDSMYQEVLQSLPLIGLVGEFLCCDLVRVLLVVFLILISKGRWNRGLLCCLGLQTEVLLMQGLLDEQFQQLQSLQDESNPCFVMEVVTLFCDDAERIFTELDKLMSQPVVEFQQVDAYIHQLKGSSSSVGAQNVKLACVQFRHSLEENGRDGYELVLKIK